MKKALKNKIKSHVTSKCFTPPHGVEFEVKNMHLQLRKGGAGRYIPGQVSYEVFSGGKKLTSGYVNLISLA